MTQKTSRERLEDALERIADKNGEGARACLTVYRDSARAAADAADARLRAAAPLGPLDGVILSIKDLFDVAGEVTRAGSKVLAAEGKIASRDAPVIARLRAAGAVIAAKTNMVEFAFSGIGTNPHFGTPGNPADRARVPGGSTSGGAVAAADGMCEIAIGSDTGGSTRIPAALCGIVGFKPTKRRISTEGAFPISQTLDSIGPLATTVAACALADAVMAGDEPVPLEPVSLNGLRIGVAQGMPLEQMDDTVALRFEVALTRLGAAGARLTDMPMPLLAGMAAINAKGGIVPAEGYAIHRARFERTRGELDPAIAARLERAKAISAVDYDEMMRSRAELVRKMDDQLAGIDVLMMPTTPIVAPTIAEVSDPQTFNRKNALVLRNPSIGNFFDLCAISLPLPRDSKLPAGLMLMARHGHDRRLFEIAGAVERLFAA
jgi:aspartyl-tRNA(Asn)/glutamyl-tRNA(Gln) amidotransferase subunit A